MPSSSIKHHAFEACRNSTSPNKLQGRAVLHDYRSIHKYLQDFWLSEHEVLMLLGLELDRKRRTSVLTRLHQRLCAMRRDREREELLDGR